jgi:hypothetical protein
MGNKLKCIGCRELRREIVRVKGNLLVTYNCPSFFPYSTAISGLIRPASGITRAAEKCPIDPTKECIICGAFGKLRAYGEETIRTCVRHYEAWSKWLDDHPEKREAIMPKGHLKYSVWIEAFREFVEEMRQPAEPLKE